MWNNLVINYNWPLINPFHWDSIHLYKFLLGFMPAHINKTPLFNFGYIHTFPIKPSSLYFYYKSYIIEILHKEYMNIPFHISSAFSHLPFLSFIMIIGFKGLFRIWHSKLPICGMWLLFLTLHDIYTFIPHHWFHPLYLILIAFSFITLTYDSSSHS